MSRFWVALVVTGGAQRDEIEQQLIAPPLIALALVSIAQAWIGVRNIGWCLRLRDRTSDILAASLALLSIVHGAIAVYGAPKLFRGMLAGFLLEALPISQPLRRRVEWERLTCILVDVFRNRRLLLFGRSLRRPRTLALLALLASTLSFPSAAFPPCQISRGYPVHYYLWEFSC